MYYLKSREHNKTEWLIGPIPRTADEMNRILAVARQKYPKLEWGWHKK